MASVPLPKLRLLRDMSIELSELELDDLNLLLFGAGIAEFATDDWTGGYNWDVTDSDRRNMVRRRLEDKSLEELQEIATNTAQLFERTVGAPPAGEPEPLFLFGSHLTAQKGLLHAVRDSLALDGIKLFVAHDDIEPEADWHFSIEDGLRRAHGAVVFLFPGFKASSWCDQEVGWLLGRGIPIRTLMFNGEAPYGPLGRRQGVVVQASLATSAQQIAKSLTEWVASEPRLRPHLNASAVNAFAQSRRFSETDRLWGLIKDATDLTAQQVATLASAVRDNDQVYGATEWGTKTWYPEVILPFLRAQPGAAGASEQIADAERARGLDLRDPAPFDDVPF